MLTRRRTWLQAAAAWAAAGALPLQAAELAALVATSKPSVLPVGTWNATDSPRFGFRGTGFVIGDGTLVATNFHVLPAGAEARYRAVLEVQPDNAMALNNVAWLLVKQGKPGALPLAERANQLLPDRAPLLDTLATVLEAEKQLPKAIDAQKRAIVLESKDPGLVLRLAKLYIKSGEKDRARAELEVLTKLGDKFAGQSEVASLLKTL